MICLQPSIYYRESNHVIPPCGCVPWSSPCLGGITSSKNGSSSSSLSSQSQQEIEDVCSSRRKHSLSNSHISSHHPHLGKGRLAPRQLTGLYNGHSSERNEGNLECCWNSWNPLQEPCRVGESGKMIGSLNKCTQFIS
jgi:hypothetical protein